MNFKLTELQYEFHLAKEEEVFFGGAAGGGKSYGQVLDAFLYALEYPGIKQIVFRRTYPELEKSFIRTTRGIYPNSIAVYTDKSHTWNFKNGSIIDFGYLQYEKDVYNYQSAEYDIIRFDESTHFTEFMYRYMKSRCRGANTFPKQMKSTSNPGNVGHAFFKIRFIDNGAGIHDIEEQGEKFKVRFIPAKLSDNKILVEKDPGYKKRLLALPEKERKALMDGDWNIFDGMFFNEFNSEYHIIEPFIIPKEWKRYIALDYGLDMFAVLFITIDTKNNAYVYKEIHESNLIVSKACELLKQHEEYKIAQYIFAPPDLWNRNRDTGKSAAEIFFENGVKLDKCNSDRVNGWLAVKEWLKIEDIKNEQTGDLKKESKLKIFKNCINLIKNLPLLQHDDKNPNDVSTEPHEITHITDALRYFCVSRTRPTEVENQIKKVFNFNIEKPPKDDWGEQIKVI